MIHFPTDTIPHALAAAAARGDRKRGYTFVAEDGITETYYPFEDLYVRVSQYATALLRLGLRPGDRVAMIIPEADAFVLTFLGAMHAGLVPVPMCPPMTLGKLGNYLESSRHTIRKSEAVALVCSSAVKNVVGSLLDESLRVICTTDELPVDNVETPLAPISASDPGFIQFTSGSTSRPKGVVLTHGNLRANAHCIMNLGLKATPDDVGCTWLPFYHDMGLIGFVLAPLVTDTPVAFMQPLAFLKRPLTWFQMIARHRGSIGFGPNFAYGLCTQRIKERDLEGIDLSSWRIAGCGAEPIQLGVLEAFADRFASVGFRREAFLPCFGMAESTLAVSFHDVDAAPKGDRILLDRLTRENVAVPAPVDTTHETAEFVSCGRAFPGHEIAIVDEAGHPVDERCVGEIVIKGPSVMEGYFKDDEITRQTVRNGWLHTGDKGYLADGELYICGRIKEMIIVAGKNYYPTDIEWACNDIPGVRKGNVVAFSVGGFGEGAERVVCALESRAPAEDHDEIVRMVKTRVLQVVGLKLDEVVLLEPGSLPKTSSGKLQRRRTRELYLENALADASKGDGRLGLAKHLAASQWSLLKNRVRRTMTGGMHVG